MPSINKTLGNVKAMKRKIDTLNVNVDVGDYWTIDVDFGDYWTVHRELESLSVGHPQDRIVRVLATDMRPLSQKKKVDKPTLLRIQKNLAAIIDWLGTLEAQAV